MNPSQPCMGWHRAAIGAVPDVIGLAFALAAWAAAGLGTAHAADPNRGAGLFARHCAACHGGSGVPVLPNAPDLTRPEALLRPDAQLLQAIRFGVGTMPGYQGILKDRQILDTISFMRTMLR